MIISIILLVILILINGVFSASELAFLSLNKFNLKIDIENGNKKAVRVKKLIDNPSTFLSTIQVAITLAGFLASAFAADVFADYFIGFISVDFIPCPSMVKPPIVPLFASILPLKEPDVA